MPSKSLADLVSDGELASGPTGAQYVEQPLGTPKVRIIENLLGAWEVGNGASLDESAGVYTITESSGGTTHFIQQVASIPQTERRRYCFTITIRSKAGEAARRLMLDVVLTGTSDRIRYSIAPQGSMLNIDSSFGFGSTTNKSEAFIDTDWAEHSIDFIVLIPPNDAIDVFLRLMNEADEPSYSGDGSAGISFRDASLVPIG